MNNTPTNWEEEFRNKITGNGWLDYEGSYEEIIVEVRTLLAAARQSLLQEIEGEVEGMKETLVYPTIPKHSQVTTEFMYIRGKAVALSDILTIINKHKTAALITKLPTV